MLTISLASPGMWAFNSATVVKPDKLSARVLSDNGIMVWKCVSGCDKSIGKGGIELASKFEIVSDGDAGTTSIIILCSLCMWANVLCSKSLALEGKGVK